MITAFYIVTGILLLGIMLFAGIAMRNLYAEEKKVRTIADHESEYEKLRKKASTIRETSLNKKVHIFEIEDTFAIYSGTELKEVHRRPQRKQSSSSLEPFEYQY
ncbi:hypothetical protein GCM10011386_33330 [Parapedobacter defluvii]|uniref:Uncharacterized protein n=1 Tax=Parapedobacter defluvii TaxID=2045106 RepID=A0ABQ1MCR0_9SPHI|nr:hypothetical protein [Parapedobacter defluvii]GGC38547.1 hypothetical protein GCM10011386_33330 [Parapedobacter defluvii]